MISIITPCLNIIQDGRLEIFKKMMMSIHSQTGVDIEHIVVDGGSTDGTLEELYTYSQLIKLYHEPKTGPYPAINMGIEKAKGNYITTMCTDDYLVDSDFYSRSIKKLEEGYDFTHADRIVTSRIRKSDWVKKGDLNVAFFRMPIRHETLIVKRSLFDEIGLYDESYIISADYKHALLMILANKKGYHFSESALVSLDGGLTSNRILCIKEASRVLYEVYGEKYGLSLTDCRQIYKKNMSLDLFGRVKTNITNKRILESLFLCYKSSKN